MQRKLSTVLKPAFVICSAAIALSLAAGSAMAAGPTTQHSLKRWSVEPAWGGIVHGFPIVRPAMGVHLLATTARMHAPQQRMAARYHLVRSTRYLAIPWRRWPAGSVPQYETVLNAAGADNHLANIFSDVLNTNGRYQTAGMIAGVSQYADALIGGGNGNVWQFWLGSYYRSAAGAAYSENVALQSYALGELTQPLTCRRFYGAVVPASCRILFGQAASDLVYIFGIWTSRNVTGEVGIVVSTENFTNYQNDVETNFGRLLLAGIRQVARA
jgi:hypothetical protein